MSTRRRFLVQSTVTAVAAITESKLPRDNTHDTGLSPKAVLKGYRISGTDLVVSRIGYGCATLVDWERKPPSDAAVAKADRLIHVAYENGITLFDLADSYCFGGAESAFGDAMRRSPGFRNRVVIQSKCGVVYGEDSQSGSPLRIDSSRHHIVDSVEASLRRLGTDHLDILLLHWPDALVIPQEVAAAFEFLKRSGKVLYFGVSNHTASQIELLRQDVREPLVVNQIYLNLSICHLMVGGLTVLWNGAKDPNDYTALSRTLDYCRIHRIQVQAYSPLRGNLIRSNLTAYGEANRTAQLLSELAMQKQTTPSAVALAWLLHHPMNILPIIGATNPDHVVANCEADRITLTDNEWYALLRSVSNDAA